VDLAKLIEQFGLPTAMLIVIVGLAVTDRFRSTTSVKEAEKKVADDREKERAVMQKEVDYREQLRLEERARADRLEQTLATTVTTLRDITEVLKDVEREIGGIKPHA
jgi:hypothetical protein